MTEQISMRGKVVDMGKLQAQQDKNIAVGNTRTNGRGDQLGRGGQVVKSASEIAREHYNQNNPKAVKRSSIKLDSEAPKETADDWVEPTVDSTEWVEDTAGNFVKKGD
jgi:hypothetical protein